MIHLLDTNTLIYYFKGIGRVAQRLLATPPRQVAVSTVTLYEIETGIAKSQNPGTRRKQLSEFESLVTVLGLGREEARTAARIRAQLEAAGTPIGPLDNLIAGIAVAQNATLVTHNVKEFQRVPGLAVLDWF
ncbi:MAG: type II toxin-antitoxin system VapC family toxin [Deltaproteobacteria bacterium]|nr:type II toxin-antitoxin system VapC family toxin [Deltaproteobacteria bacterium]